METLAYLQLVLACEAPEYKPPSPKNRQRTAFNPWLGIFSCVLILEALTGNPALALLQFGSQGSEVTELQTRLIAGRYLYGQATGNYDGVTQTAVENFQRANGLAVDGIAGKNTLAALQRYPAAPIDRPEPSPPAQTPAPSPSQNPAPSPSQTPTAPSSSQTLRQGSEGSAVTALQRQLGTAGYYSGPITGYFGSLTQEAVQKLQAAQGLTVDGIYGPATQSRLQRLLAQPQQTCRCDSDNRGSTGSTPNQVPGSAPLVNRQPVTPTVYSRSTPVYYRPAPSALYSRTTPVYYRPNPAYAYYPRTLRKGQKGSAVTDLQNRLRLAGYPTPVTGRFDDQTQRAVMRFQLARGILADGVAGPSTLAALGIPGFNRVVRGSASEAAVAKAAFRPNRLPARAAPLVAGSSARLSVLDLQRRLAARGFNPGPLDGIWGPRTQAAVARAQQLYRIRRDDVLRGSF